MELRHLRYFCAIAELRGFTAAARQLNVSQSGVSGQIKSLEEEVGLALFRRNKREISLTPGGVVFLEEARDILMRVERAVELAHRATKGTSGKLTIGLCGPVTANILPKVIRVFRKRFPGVALSLKERAPSEQVNALLSGQIDIGFARSIAPEVKHLLGHRLLFREPAIVAIPKGHPLAELDEVPLSKLAQERLILFFRDGAPEVFDAIISMCKKQGFGPRVVDTPPSWHSVLTMVESHEGLALVPECVKHLKGNDIVFRPLREPGCKLDAVVAWRRNEPSVLPERFLELLIPKRAAPGRGQDG